ncbi:MAG: type II secretion system F family protein [Coriobacteriales bacterium]|jgi:tight adherence protein C|nr:type II secretion system F family protein [Coriobacteriales bacterium]
MEWLLSVLACTGAGLAAFLAATCWLQRRQGQLHRQQRRRQLQGGATPGKDGQQAQALNRQWLMPGALIGRVLSCLPGQQRRLRQRQLAAFERDLPAMLEIIALGMHAGMGFDQAFGLYVRRFDSKLAQVCREPFEIWEKGLISRADGLAELASRVDTPLFARFSTTAARALRFGAPLTQLLSDLAEEARRDYRAKRQEMVAKAPVKMLLPTGGLILPAMLLLVMGPIILDLIGKLG